MKMLRRALAVVPTIVGGSLLAVAAIPGALGVAFVLLGEWLWGQEPPAEPERVKPDYDSIWTIDQHRDGSVSIYRNGSRYTTQTSLQSMRLSGAEPSRRDSYFGVIPPELREEMRSKLEVSDLLREWDRAVRAGNVSWMDCVEANMAKVLEARTGNVVGPLERSLADVLKRGEVPC